MPPTIEQLERPRSAPPEAVIEVTRPSEHGPSGTVSVGGRMVVQVLWNERGGIELEKYFDREGRPHGLERQRDDDGQLVWCAEWVHGRMHGRCIMFDGGRPMAVTHFVEGRGVDIWAGCGGISEVREMAEGVPHGFVRWGRPTAPWEEEHFALGSRHGIFRRWDDDTGELAADYPQYFVHDERVTAEAYELARQGDPTLPAYREQDDVSERPMPAVVTEALQEAERLAASFDLDAYLRSADEDVDWSAP